MSTSTSRGVAHLICADLRRLFRYVPVCVFVVQFLNFPRWPVNELSELSAIAGAAASRPPAAAAAPGRPPAGSGARRVSSRREDLPAPASEASSPAASTLPGSPAPEATRAWACDMIDMCHSMPQPSKVLEARGVPSSL